ncbi:EKA-like protein [Blumeria hordei DH14]|uniref:EKA-like protein n=1 Tax=Blumeria graminis f. sp. hordei (strain DH14) TaxID=546991 RepID=N1J8N2_BLUG1|nr:EKA-like protein [Blumeria hordei DH14]
MALGQPKKSREDRVIDAIGKAHKNVIKRMIDKNSTVKTIDYGKMDLELIERINAFEENTSSSNTDIEMSDRTFDIYLKEGLSSSRSNLEDSEDSQVTIIPAITTRKIAVPAVRWAATVHISKDKVAASPKNLPDGTSGITVENSASHSEGNPKLTEEYPSELWALTEAEERWTAKIAENVKICTAAINGVENALSPLSKGTSVKFIDSMKVYIRAAIAQFMISGPGTVLPALPSRPETQATGSKITEYAAKKQDEPQSKVTQDKVSQAKRLWPQSPGMV